MRHPHEPLASRALDALADQCEIPDDLSDRILAAALDEAPAPVIAPPAPVIELPRESSPMPRAPLSGVIRATQQDERTWRRTLWAAAATLTLLLGVAITHRASAPQRAYSASPTSIQMGAAPPPGAQGTRVPDGHPRLEEAKGLVLVLASRVAGQCKAERWSASVRFEKTGQATVLSVTGAGASERGCIERLLADARISPRGGPRLAVWLDHEPGAATRVAGWLLDET